jgi:hypothetical protein
MLKPHTRHPAQPQARTSGQTRRRTHACGRAGGRAIHEVATGCVVSVLMVVSVRVRFSC